MRLVNKELEFRLFLKSSEINRQWTQISAGLVISGIGLDKIGVHLRESAV
jgi:hypothetical protein